MKKRPSVVTPRWSLLFPILIDRFRKLHKLPKGPEEHLQTREFRALIDDITAYLKKEELPEARQVAAYLLHEWPLCYAQGISLLRELPKSPARVLELGHGPFALAALEYGASDVWAVSDSIPRLRESAQVAGQFGYSLTCRSLQDRYESPFDLIIIPDASHHHISMVRSLLNQLTDQGHLLLVASSLPQENHAFLALRDLCAKEHLHIRAPCLWKGNCPALQNNSYCYAQRKLEKPRMMQEIHKALSLHQQSLKMSYLLLSKQPIELPDSETWYRIVSPPVSTYKGERLFLCGTKGSATLGSSLTEHTKETKAFSFLQRGDVVSVQNTEELDRDFLLTKESTLRLIAPLDKPLPVKP